MRRILAGIALAGCLVVTGSLIRGEEVPKFRDLFNGKDLTGWVNVNTDPDTFKVKDGMIVCTGKPIGIMRTDRQYENFLLHVEWRHMEQGGNSGMFAWSSARPGEKNRLPDGVEIQMLEPGWVDLPKIRENFMKKNGQPPPLAYVTGELFGVGGLTTVPDLQHPGMDRSMAAENRMKGMKEWNTYDVVAIDGVIKLSVNGKFVNGISKASQKKGYLCLESEGAEIHFRSIKIMELLPGITTPEQTAPEFK